MSYNHGKSERLFEKEWNETRGQLEAAGVAEEKIMEFYEFERERFNSDRRFYERNINQEQAYIEECSGPYYDDYFNEPENWQDNIEDRNLYIAINMLTDKQKKLVSRIYVEGFDVGDICVMRGVSRQSVHVMKGAALKKLKKKVVK